MDLVYRAMMEPDAWQLALDELSSIVPGGQGVMLFHDTTTAHGAFTLTSGFDPGASAQYDKYYNALNPWMPGAAVRPIGLGVRAEQMLPRTELGRTEFFTDWLRPQGLSTGIGLTVSRRRGRVFLVSVIGAEGDGERWSAGADILTAISPHLGRATEIYRRAASGAVEMDAARNLLGGVECSVFTVGEGRRLIWMNEPAKRTAERADVVRISPGGRATLTVDDANSLLDKMLNDVPVGSNTPRTATFTGRTKSGGLVRFGLVNASRSKFEFYLRGPTVFVILYPGRATRRELSAEMRLRFGLTPREAEIATALSEGHSIETIAQKFGSGRETIRVHVKSVFAKMGVRRQSEVVAAFLSLATRNDRRLSVYSWEFTRSTESGFGQEC